MNRRSSGRVPGQFAPLGSEAGDHGGAAITLDPTNAIDLELMHPLIEYDAAGKPVGISKATDLLRSSAGITVMEKLRENKAAGKRHAPGEMHLDDNGELQGLWLAPDVLREVASKHKFNPEQAQVMRSVNAAIKTGDGNRMVVINFPATEKTRSGKVVYATKKATIRDIVPVALTITKDNNLLIGLMSVTKLHENIVKRAQSKRGKKLYGGNTDLILQDVRAMMDFHKQGTDSIEHFKAKYGAVEADERKKFINTIFGLMNKSEQAVLNPMLLEDGVKSSDNVYRTYRVDRVSKAVPMDPIQNPPMPFNYEAAKQVNLPERMLPEPGTPAHDAAYLEAAESGDMATAQRMVEQAAMAAGYDVGPVYHGTPNGEFTEFDTATQGATGTAANAFWFTEDRKMAENFANLAPTKSENHSPKILSAFLKSGDKPSKSDFKDIPASRVGLAHSRRASVLSRAKRDKRSSVKFTNMFDFGGPATVHAVFDPNQIKSADAITRDDSGKIIPLSERFNAKSADLRYLPEPLENGGQTPPKTAESGRAERSENPDVSLREPKNVGGGNEKTMGISKPLEGFARPDTSKPWVREERSSFADIDAQEAELAKWAADNGKLLTESAIQDIRAKNYPTKEGNEHIAVLAPDGVYRFTNGDKYGMPYRTPSEYLARWDKSNKLFPETAVDFVGFYQKPSGVGVIVTRQPFIKGKRGTAKQIEAAMKKRGFEPTGNHSFRHPETGIELYDAHEDNVMFDDKNNIMPFDVWVNDPNNILAKP